MTKSVRTMMLGALLLASAISAPDAQGRVDVQVGIGIPPPPAVVFDREPGVVLVPQTQVYYVPDLDYDLYRFGGYWYINRHGYWYRSSSYRGPFAPIVYERVPHAIIAVPSRFHRAPIHPANWHGGPPHAHPVSHHAPHRDAHAHHGESRGHEGHDRRDEH